MDLAQRLLVVLRHVGVHDDAPLGTVRGLAVLGRRLLVDAPLLAEHLRSAGNAGADREDAQPMLAGRDHARGRDGAGAGDGEMRVAVGREMEPRLLQLEPVGLHRDRLLAFEQAHDRLQRLLHARPLGRGIDAHHVGVGRQRAGAATHHRAAARHVVELHEAVRDHQRVVVGQAGHARAEPDVARALDGGGDENFRRGDGFPAGGVMLADPRLVEAQLVDPLDQLHVARHRERRVFAHAMERRQEDAERQSLVIARLCHEILRQPRR